ncbi:SAM-dependent DNA methyltransferase, partial [bacterium]|nr:SAM-dependent DNA methyltransferase [bacterium]
SVSNKIRKDFLRYYNIKTAVIFEKEIFKYTGTNVIICFFERKENPKDEIIKFTGIKINRETNTKEYVLTPQNNYRAGNEFGKFVNEYKAIKPIRINYYLNIEEIEKNKGDFELKVIDANAFNNNKYQNKTIYVNKKLYTKTKSNVLFIRTVDTGSSNGKAGLYTMKEVFNVDGILVTKSRYRTHPIQIFIEPILSYENQILLKDYFNLILEYFREKTDSEFMTTYKYSNSEYTRKYLGLSQAKKIMKTFPFLSLKNNKIEFKELIYNKDAGGIIDFIRKTNKNEVLELWQ